MEILSSIALHSNLALARAVNGFVAAAPAKRLEDFFFFFFFFFSPAPASESLLFFFFFIFGGGAVGGGASGSPASGGGGPAGALMVAGPWSLSRVLEFGQPLIAGVCAGETLPKRHPKVNLFASILLPLVIMGRHFCRARRPGF